MYVCVYEGEEREKVANMSRIFKRSFVKSKMGRGKYIYRCQYQEEEDGGIF